MEIEIENMMKIDVETYSLTSKNFHQIETEKTQIVIGNSLRKNNFHIIRLSNSEFGQSKKWNTFTISRSGEIFQHYNPKYYGDYIDEKRIDKQIISIVLENMGCLFQVSNGNYVNGLNEKCNHETVEKKWLGFNVWEKYGDEQLKSLEFLCKKLSKEFNIPLNCVPFFHYNKDIIKYNGIAFKCNFIENSDNCNPTFNIEKFLESLNKQ